MTCERSSVVRIALKDGHLRNIAGAWVRLAYGIECVQGELVKCVDVAPSDVIFQGVNDGFPSEKAVFGRDLRRLHD